MALATTNPATGEVLKTFEPLTDSEIEKSVITRQRNDEDPQTKGIISQPVQNKRRQDKPDN